MCYVVGLSSYGKVLLFCFFCLSGRGERGCAFAVFVAHLLKGEFLTTYKCSSGAWCANCW